MRDQYYPTGNDYVALPTINNFGEIESFNVVSMADRGLLEVSGAPFLRIELEIDGQILEMSDLKWQMLDEWMPCFTLIHNEIKIDVTYIAPQNTRGWFLEVNIDAKQTHDISLRLFGQFNQLLHSINETKICSGEIIAYKSLWNDGYMFDFRKDITKLSFGFVTDGGFDEQTLGESDGIFCLTKILQAKQQKFKTNSQHYIYMGVGLEEVGAATQAVHMQREGGKFLKSQLSDWLQSRLKTTGDAKIDRILNRNLFFNYFYATGRSFDTEELILCTSRSPRYYVSAAYWDRDSLIWSFPALLTTDVGIAKEALDYVFGRQIKNIGIHSRYIDGTVLEPGFELDELCAPILALEQYFNATQDWDYLGSTKIREGIAHIVARLKQWRHKDIDLYGTFLMPTDDMKTYDYLTYNNVLVWKILIILNRFYKKLQLTELAEWAIDNAELVKAAINRHCIKSLNGGPQYVWSVDLNGNYDTYDEPPGSLTLLAYYGFCDSDDEVFKNTLASLYCADFPHYFANTEFEELGCTHADYPWILSMCNSLLNGRRDEAIDMLQRTKMDNYIACESIDATTGDWATGAHFATCAGFLVHALLHSYAETK
ncbi:MAG: glycoside hydrolase family 125 protein [Rhizobiales bacterium]|nr:glycoside hydrolase family 125 protein [Hyphomicrobiales bacterium]NRB15583.1 glycoside hydrolase family 125 protein [Hyphomicrobiales bacterium]